jgi:hypothetical protein
MSFVASTRARHGKLIAAQMRKRLAIEAERRAPDQALDTGAGAERPEERPPVSMPAIEPGKHVADFRAALDR